MAVRDKILPVIDKARAKIASLGLRRYTVTIRRRTWSGERVGAGAVVSTIDITLTPAPSCRPDSQFAEQKNDIVTSVGTMEDRFFTIDNITPQYTGNTSGGYAPGELNLTPESDAQEVLVVLVGDDGIEREATVVGMDFSKSFSYQLTVRLKRRSTI